MKRWAKISRVMTVVTVLALMIGSYTALQWMEEEKPRTVVGSEKLNIDFEAPARHAQGPWDSGHVFDRSSVGVPLGLAPQWEITAAYSQSASTAPEGRWDATVDLNQRASGGGEWWSHEEQIEMTEMGDRAKFSLDVSALVEKADRMMTDSGVPGRLQIIIAVHHTSTVRTEHGPTETMRTARLLIDPQDSFVRVEAHDDNAVYHSVEKQSFPVTVASLGLFAVTSGGMALFARLRVPSSPLRTALPVRNLQVPDQAVQVDAVSLARLARSSASTLLVDQDTGLLYLAGDLPMIAQVDADQMERLQMKNDPQRERRAKREG